MPMEVAGSLIEMNVHDVLDASASILCQIGRIGIIVSILGIFSLLLIDGIKSKTEWITACIITMIICAGLLIFGKSMPKVKEINYCANGPVQIEQIAATYDIVKIDGKQITVRERGK